MMTRARSRLGVLAGLATLFAALFTGLVVASTAAAAPAPSWHILSRNVPTNFRPGTSAEENSTEATPPYVQAVVTNAGGASAEQFQVAFELPVGLLVSEVSTISVLRVNGEVEFDCEVALDRRSVVCTIKESLRAGDRVLLSVPVDVSSALAGQTVITRISATGGGAGATTLALPTLVDVSEPQFGLVQGGLGFSVGTEGGLPATQAGSHPFDAILASVFPVKTDGELLRTAGAVRNLDFDLPSGFVLNPQAVTLCKPAELVEAGCPPESQVGLVRFDTAKGGAPPVVNFTSELFALEPSPGVPAEFALEVAGVFVHLRGGLDGGFHLVGGSRDLLQVPGIPDAEVVLWGNPSDPRHDFQRGGIRGGVECRGTCSVAAAAAPLLTMPSACSSSLAFSVVATSWDDPPGTPVRIGEGLVAGPEGSPLEITGCERLPFSPSVEIEASSQTTESPTGLSLHLHLPQSEGVNGLATAALKKVELNLPAGMTVNPSTADGLSGCAPAEIGIGNTAPAACPGSSKIGTAKISTPLLASPLEGSIYVAQQGDNPFGTLLALYLVVEGEGIVLKLPGRVDPNPSSGQLTASFDNNPQLPFTDLQVDLNGGSRAALITPAACGTYSVRSALTSWASPNPVIASEPITIDAGCATGGFAPRLQAGTFSPIAGRYSPFTLRVTREPGEQNISRLDTTLPKGLLAKLAGVPLCPDAAAGTAACPAASKVGNVVVGAGAGPLPLYVPQPGRPPTAIFLAGPYRGAPYSLVVRVPAQAGPFDLGTIATRVALQVDPFTAQVTAASDPLPQILQGVPIAYRDVRVNVDRDNFILNPTSCDPARISAAITSSAGAVATPTDRFQVAGCERLAFKPKLRLSLKGATRRSGHPALRAVLTFPKKGRSANIARARVGLPHSEFLDQGNIGTVCKQSDLRAGTCPKGSIYGRATAYSPLLDKPLKGPVYLGVGFGHELPDLVADLNGQIRVLVHGKVDTDRQEGIRNTFEMVPDAPVSRFVLELKGGPKKGLLVNSTDICKGTHRAEVRLTGQNAALYNSRVKLSARCGARS